jgi:hypothetical protein
MAKQNGAVRVRVIDGGKMNAENLQQLHQTGTPLVLTVSREGLADSAAGRVKPARKALQALAKEYGITGGDDAL